MNIVTNQGAQGDVLFRRVDALPAGARDITPDEGKVIVAHSETGHHHIASATEARIMAGPDPLVCYLQASDNIIIEHLRPFDTHETFALACGPGVTWEVRRQREHTPEGWRMVVD